MTSFDRFKKELILERLVEMSHDIDCDFCPASDYCIEKYKDSETPCKIIIQEWGLQDETEAITTEINRLKQEMMDLIDIHGRNHDLVIAKSQELDKYILKTIK